MKLRLNPVAAFFLLTLLALVPSLSVWYALRDWLCAPVIWLSRVAMMHFYPSWVLDVEANGSVATLKTILKAMSPQGRMQQVGLGVDILPYCYGFALLLALFLASKSRQIWWKFPVGAILLLPFQAWGPCFKWVFLISSEIGRQTAAQTGFTATHTMWFGLAQQFGILLFPTVVPILIWLIFERPFVTRLVLDFQPPRPVVAASSAPAATPVQDSTEAP